MLRKTQRGAVLATSLIILVVMTLLVLAMLKSSVLDLKIGGIAQTGAQNFSNADVALVKFINDNNGRFADGCLTAASGTSCFCTNPDSAQCQSANVGGNQTSYVSGATPKIQVGDPSLSAAAQPLFGAQQTDITATQLSGCVEAAARGGGSQLCNPGEPCIKNLYFDIAAVSNGVVSGQATVHQGIVSFCP